MSLTAAPAASDQRRGSVATSSAGSTANVASLRMGQFYKTKTCPWFFKGRCERGIACRFAHNEKEKRQLPDLSRTSFCPTMLKTGACPNPTCRFAHHAGQLRATQDMYKTSLCFLFMKSRCAVGAACRHAHGVHELRVPPAGAATTDNASTTSNTSPAAAATNGSSGSQQHNNHHQNNNTHHQQHVTSGSAAQHHHQQQQQSSSLNGPPAAPLRPGRNYARRPPARRNNNGKHGPPPHAATTSPSSHHHHHHNNNNTHHNPSANVYHSDQSSAAAAAPFNDPRRRNSASSSGSNDNNTAIFPPLTHHHSSYHQHNSNDKRRRHPHPHYHPPHLQKEVMDDNARGNNTQQMQQMQLRTVSAASTTATARPSAALALDEAEPVKATDDRDSGGARSFRERPTKADDTHGGRTSGGNANAIGAAPFAGGGRAAGDKADVLSSSLVPRGVGRKQQQHKQNKKQHLQQQHQHHKGSKSDGGYGNVSASPAAAAAAVPAADSPALGIEPAAMPLVKVERRNGRWIVHNLAEEQQQAHAVPRNLTTRSHNPNSGLLEVDDQRAANIVTLDASPPPFPLPPAAVAAPVGAAAFMAGAAGDECCAAAAAAMNFVGGALPPSVAVCSAGSSPMCHSLRIMRETVGSNLEPAAAAAAIANESLHNPIASADAGQLCRSPDCFASALEPDRLLRPPPTTTIQPRHQLHPPPTQSHHHHPHNHLHHHTHHHQQQPPPPAPQLHLQQPHPDDWWMAPVGNHARRQSVISNGSATEQESTLSAADFALDPLGITEFGQGNWAALLNLPPQRIRRASDAGAVGSSREKLPPPEDVLFGGLESLLDHAQLPHHQHYSNSHSLYQPHHLHNDHSHLSHYHNHRMQVGGSNAKEHDAMVGDTFGVFPLDGSGGVPGARRPSFIAMDAYAQREAADTSPETLTSLRDGTVGDLMQWLAAPNNEDDMATAAACCIAAPGDQGTGAWHAED